jgi:RimJ/RimL family protein N-acetyltransferase
MVSGLDPEASDGRAMPAPRQSMIPPKIIRIHSEHYLVRSIAAADASERWAGWMGDPEAIHMLNLPARTWTKADVVDYIKTFDQRGVLLLGIFEKASGAHIGILTVDVNQVTGQFLVNMLIGEPAYRRQGVTWEITVPFRDYFFETLGLKVALASVLARNIPITDYLIKTGWKRDQTLARAAKSNQDGGMLDLCLFSLSREAWRAWKKSRSPGDKA